MALKCSQCGQVSKGGEKGFWSKGKLGLVKMMIVFFSISSGFSVKHIVDHIGYAINENTWKRIIKSLRIVSADMPERVRRDPGNKWMNMQHDETAFGKS